MVGLQKGEIQKEIDILSAQEQDDDTVSLIASLESCLKDLEIISEFESFHLELRSRMNSENFSTILLNYIQLYSEEPITVEGSKPLIVPIDKNGLIDREILQNFFSDFISLIKQHWDTPFGILKLLFFKSDKEDDPLTKDFYKAMPVY